MSGHPFPPGSETLRGVGRFEQMRVPKDAAEAFEMLEFWARNTVEQIDKTAAAGWDATAILGMARGDLSRALSLIDRMEKP